MNKKEIFDELLKIGCIKYGEFKLKSGKISNYYFDFRILVSYPKLLKNVSLLMFQILPKEIKETIQIICGVPYGALAIATVISTSNNIPMLLLRKEVKDYGTKKLIEGVYEEGFKCLIVEDVVTTGSSIISTYDDLIKEKIDPIASISILDREEENGKENLEKKGLKVFSLFTISEIKEFLKNKEIEKKELTFKERSKITKNSTTKRLFEIMEEKETNLCISADVTTKKELLNIAEKCGSLICMLKTHMDIISDFDEELIVELKSLSQKHNFLIFEDRKFSDIGEISKKQFENGYFKISKWADVIDCHLISGSSIVKSLSNDNLNFGIFIISQMSTVDTLTDNSTIDISLKCANENNQIVSGFICQKRITDDLSFVYCTPY
jgi:uridine monophosphate synthetase